MLVVVAAFGNAKTHWNDNSSRFVSTLYSCNVFLFKFSKRVKCTGLLLIYLFFFYKSNELCANF